MKRRLSRLWLWFNGGGSRRRVIVTPALALLVTIVSLTWHLHGWPHALIRELCGYRGWMMTTHYAYRLPGGAVLIPNDDFYLSLPGLIAALYPLERRVGSWHVLATIVFAHVFASIVAGISVRLMHDDHALHVLDVGTSVLMTSSAAMLATYTRNKWVWIVVFALYGLDLALSHDLASAEHSLAIGCGIASGFGYERIQERISAHSAKTFSDFC